MIYRTGYLWDESRINSAYRSTSRRSWSTAGYGAVAGNNRSGSGSANGVDDQWRVVGDGSEGGLAVGAVISAVLTNGNHHASLAYIVKAAVVRVVRHTGTVYGRRCPVCNGG